MSITSRRELPTPTLGDRPAAACLLVPHGQGYIKSIQALELWRMHMDKTGSALDAELDKTETGRYGHKCVVCQKTMTRGADDHLKSKSHWTELCKKVGKNMPQPRLALEKGKSWWQEFSIPQGKCLLNHLTGGLEIAGAEPAGYTSGCNGAANGASSSSASSQSSSADAAAIMIVPHYTTWRQVLSESLETWLKFMEPAATVLEEQVPHSYDCVCTVCGNKVMTSGAKHHLTSQGHWQNLIDKMQTLSWDLPPDSMTGCWPWVQEIPTPSGTYIFNHITMGQLLKKTRKVGPTKLPTTYEEFIAEREAIIAEALALLREQDVEIRRLRLQVALSDCGDYQRRSSR
ncbi:unnamed protein product [Symbiodinium sp. CCMP2592]|nr:unnamed protein product [Symbiodinium sp. CCMP2592]